MPGEDVHALRQITLEIDAGECVSIVGSSGSGKTTLLYLLGLLTDPSRGEYRFDGAAVEDLGDRERSALRGREIGFVFQSFHLLPQLSVLDNVRLAARYAGLGEGVGALQARSRKLLEKVGLAHRLQHRPRELSGGEMQRVAIARALLSEPSVILADEPTGNLDDTNGDRVFGLLQELSDDGKTVVIVTHDLALASKTGRMISLKDGEVVDGSLTAA
ncbi:MAG: macrolide ABC transporter ATP-binding protein [Planctomycetes bacterium]|nr:macrolide ABC transporter ATP-binding protein [Planctomycetota bacterium]